MNPRDAVIDAIDQLVDEQLAGGPVDDFSVDRCMTAAVTAGKAGTACPTTMGCPLRPRTRLYQIRGGKRKPDSAGVR